MSAETDLIRQLGHAFGLLAKHLPPRKFDLETREFAQRLGRMSEFYADHPESRTDDLAKCIIAETSILANILAPGSNRKRGRPRKDSAEFHEGLFVIPAYNGFRGSRTKAVRHLVDNGLITLKPADTLESWVKYLDRLSAKLDRKSV